MIEILPVPFSLDIEALVEKLKIRSSMLDEFTTLAEQAAAAAKPKMLLMDAFVDERAENSIVINGVKFHSTVLCRNLEGIGRVFPYITTCGREVADLPIDPKDFVLHSWLHYIKLDVLKNCFPVLHDTVKARYGVEKVSSMNPGSGDAAVWPIEQQAGLFQLFGNVEELVGVRLTESYLMDPDISTSGILFPSSAEYKSCQLCHRANCPNRVAPFDARLWEKMNL